MRFFILILACLITLSCEQRIRGKGFSYKIYGEESIETAQDISPIDSLSIVECIPIEIMNEDFDSLILYHDFSNILNLGAVEAFGRECGYFALSDISIKNQTVLYRGDAKRFYLDKPKEEKACIFDSVVVSITCLGNSETYKTGSLSITLKN